MECDEVVFGLDALEEGDDSLGDSLGGEHLQGVEELL